MMKYRLRRFQNQITQIFICLILVISLTGCESLVKKFTRKPKGPPKKEEPVIVPQAYVLMPTEQAYRQYFLFWKSWQDETISALTDSGNQKKRAASMSRVLEHLENMKNYLNAQTQEKLDKHIQILQNINDQISSGNLNPIIISRFKTKLEKEKLLIEREFNYSKIKDKLKQ